MPKNVKGDVDQKALERKKRMQKDADKKRKDREGRKLTEQQMAAFNQGGFNTEQVVTDIKTPEWVEMLLAVTRISELQIRIEEERAERAKETFQNPYQGLFNLVSSIKFEVFIACLILLNCLEIGLEASWPNDSAAGLFNALEHLFVAIFLGEWCLRMRAFGWVWVFDTPNTADTFLVFATGVVPKWLLEPAGWDLGTLRILTVLRALRLVRIVRVVRLLPQFKELWMLIQGLMQSARPLIWTSVIGLMILYIFGIAATELIGRNDAFADDDYVQERFGNPLRSMFTMFQLMTMDTWGYTIARPVMEKDWGMCLFFVLFIFVAVFVFWNLITAVLVENAMSIANEDAQQQAKELEAKKKKDLRILADIFLEIDKDGSGELSHEEFSDALDNPRVMKMMDLIEVKMEEVEEIWNVLDDGDGVLTIKEFSSGLRRMKGAAKSKDIVDTLKKLRQTALYCAELNTQVQDFTSIMACLEHDVARIQQDTGEVLGLFQEMYHRLDYQMEREASEDRMACLRKAYEESSSSSDSGESEDEGEAGKVEDALPVEQSTSLDASLKLT